MTTELYSNIYIQIILFALLAAVLLISSISLFIRPAKRTIRASLVEASTGHIVDISQAETSIGRAKACDVVITAMSVSRFHAVLSKRKAGWMIFDTNSTSGTFVNGEKVEKKAILNDGDSVVFGDTEYVFYSTAVTTRQQVTRKKRNGTGGYRTNSSRSNTSRSDKAFYIPDDDTTIEYKSPKKTKKNNKK